MNTSKLKTFAQQSRRILMEGVTRKLRYWGFNENGEVIDEPRQVGGGIIIRGEPVDDPTVLHKWEALKKSIRRHGVEATIEEAAYTWFNRLMAIRILSKNGYDPAQLEYEGEGSRLPVMLAKARRGMTSYLNKEEQQRLQLFLTDYSQETKAFAILITGYCHSHKLLNRVFGRLNDFTELLLPDNILAEKGFIHLLNTTEAIAEEDYKEVELIGWLYQFYISEKKDEVFKAFKKNKKAEAEDIPAATQIFTPNWIVKYMVQNTAGRIWLDHHPDSPLREKMKYLVEKPTEETSERPLSPLGGTQGGEADTGTRLLKDGDPIHLKLLDPATGSGHILVEGFALLYEMYMEEYYLPAEAVENILTRNLFGLELDLRATQLARFAVLLAAAKKEPGILKKDILPRIYAMPEPAEFTPQEVRDFLGNDGLQHEKVLVNVLQLMQQAQNLGSVMQFNVKEEELQFFKQRWEHLLKEAKTNLTTQTLVQKLEPFLNVFFALTRKYEAIAANPPYMGQKSMNKELGKYLQDNYPVSKSDLMTVFMEVIPSLTIPNGFFALINLPSWLFLSSFEKLRKQYLKCYHFESLLHMGRGIFGIDFGSVAFSLKKQFIKEGKGTYFRLHERTFQHIYYADIEKLFLYSKGKPEYKYDFSFYRDIDGTTIIPEKGNEKGLRLYYPNIPQSNFFKIPGSPIAYWVSMKVNNIFNDNFLLNEFGRARRGLQPGYPNRFKRYWFEVNQKDTNEKYKTRKKNISSNYTWFFYSDGGTYRKWYGSIDYVIKWKNNGYEIKNTEKAIIPNEQLYFLEGLTWNKISSFHFGVRYLPQGIISGDASPIFITNNPLFFIGVLNSKIVSFFLSIISPTLNFTTGNLALIPIKIDKEEIVISLTKESIDIVKNDWNQDVTSWEFQYHSLCKNLKNSLKESYENWALNAAEHFYQLHANEEELNRIFIDIYGLYEELDPVVPLKDITILQEELDRKALEKTDKELRKYRRWKLEEGKWQLYVDGELIPPLAEGELPPATVQPELPIKKDVVMRQFISYAIGCMMGRYSLDKPGLILANQGETLDDYHRIIAEGESSFSKGGGERQRDGGFDSANHAAEPSPNETSERPLSPYICVI